MRRIRGAFDAPPGFMFGPVVARAESTDVALTRHPVRVWDQVIKLAGRGSSGAAGEPARLIPGDHVVTERTTGTVRRSERRTAQPEQGPVLVIDHGTPPGGPSGQFPHDRRRDQSVPLQPARFL